MVNHIQQVYKIVDNIMDSSNMVEACVNQSGGDEIATERWTVLLQQSKRKSFSKLNDPIQEMKGKLCKNLELKSIIC